MNFTRLTGPVGNVEGLDRLPRLGKIRLGIKKKSAKTGKEYPSETDPAGVPINWFVCPPEVEEAFGPNPLVLRGMFPSNNPEEVYQEKLAMYGQTTGLKCHGDGTTAKRRTETGEWVDRKCPCEFLKTKENPSGACTPQAHLKIMLPEVKRGMWGYYQITTHSIYARGGILGSLKHMLAMIGRVGFVPIKLFREAQDIQYEGKKKIHYILKFEPDLTTPQIAEMRSKPDTMLLPAAYEVEPVLDENPKDDPVDLVVDEDEDGEGTLEAADLASMDDAELESVQKELQARRAAKAKAPIESKRVAEKTTTPPRPTPTPPAKPTARPADTATTNGTLIPRGAWDDIISYIKSYADFNTLLVDWKQENHIADELKLIQRGQQNLLTYMREKLGADYFPY